MKFQGLSPNFLSDHRTWGSRSPITYILVESSKNDLHGIPIMILVTTQCTCGRLAGVTSSVDPSADLGWPSPAVPGLNRYPFREPLFLLERKLTLPWKVFKRSLISSAAIYSAPSKWKNKCPSWVLKNSYGITTPPQRTSEMVWSYKICNIYSKAPLNQNLGWTRLNHYGKRVGVWRW